MNIVKQYMIDSENGVLPIGNLPIGARVVDPSWAWEYKLGDNYSDKNLQGKPIAPGEVKSVIWIVVAKDYYSGIGSHATLLTEELIGFFAFDDSINYECQFSRNGRNRWGDSGSANAEHGLRPWLNSTGIHADEGFFQSFSESFKNVVLTTPVPNQDRPPRFCDLKKWIDESEYNTLDKVYIPSLTELLEISTSQRSVIYPYFHGANTNKLIAGIAGEPRAYWSRSLDLCTFSRVEIILGCGGRGCLCASDSLVGVRPTLNLKAETMVTEITN